jgi:hypothetical protein
VIANLAPILQVRGVFKAAQAPIQKLDSYQEDTNEELSKSIIGHLCDGRPSRMLAIQCEFDTEEQRVHPGHNR